MCCFSREVRSVSATRIFARHLPDARQALVYSMTLDAPTEVAMILPIPVAQGTKEDAVKFVDLSGYARFLDDVEGCFPPQVELRRFSTGPSPGAAAPPPPLRVVEVGSFRASFVPTVADFGRLDPQFRLPADVWAKVGQYDRYGFAVFKLKQGNQKIHPMAFEFPTAMPGKLFFPTVHIHDGKVHPKAEFDHVLFCQGRMARGASHNWDESARLAGFLVKVGLAKGLVAGDQHLYRRRIIGELENRDVLLAVA